MYCYIIWNVYHLSKTDVQSFVCGFGPIDFNNVRTGSVDFIKDCQIIFDLKCPGVSFKNTRTVYVLVTNKLFLLGRRKSRGSLSRQILLVRRLCMISWQTVD